jgi:hypothetical protein
MTTPTQTGCELMHVKTDDEWRSDAPSLLEALREFGAVMRSQPFQNREGLRGVSAFALYWFLRQLTPTLVLEVGVWKGFSTWIIEQAVPEAAVLSFDPIFLFDRYLKSRRVGKRYRSPRVTYSAQDFSCAPIAEAVAGHAQPVVFFDDHQNKLPRLLQCRAAGIKHAIFDDNTREFLSHRTLEHDRSEPRSAAILDRLVEAYEVFPALWPVDASLAGYRIEEEGLGLPVEEGFANIHAERDWHSYVTYVRLR